MLEFCAIIVLGVLAQWAAWNFKIPAILPLILIGLIVGPLSIYFSHDGTKLIEPIWNGRVGLFPGEGLFNFVSLSIGIILFEGGLTLRREEITNIAPVIIKLVIAGTIVTFLGGAFVVHYLFELSWPISFVFSSLIIVTGPTVIAPILRNLKIKREVSAILKWESILIDPVGVLVAVLVFEFIMAGEHGNMTEEALITFGRILIIGIAIGFAGAYSLYFMIRRKSIPNYLLNVVTLVFVLVVFVFSDYLEKESGLLSVVIMGIMLGSFKISKLKEILYFKESISILLISMLFILLTANINIEDLILLLSWKSILLFLIVVLVLRPLSVFISTYKSPLKTREKVFISWVGPRGIVAAGIASLFGLKLEAIGEEGAEYIISLVFLIVSGTVLLNATTARPLAKMLGINLKMSNRILIVGASLFSRTIAQYLLQNNRSVLLIDTNSDNVEKASQKGIPTIEGDIYDEDIEDQIEHTDIGYLMVMTGNAKVNDFALDKFKGKFGFKGAFRLVSKIESENPKDNPDVGLFSHTDDYLTVRDIVRKYPKIHEFKLKSKKHFIDSVNYIRQSSDVVPLFIKDNKGGMELIPSYSQEMTIEKGYKLVYLGKEIQL